MIDMRNGQMTMAEVFFQHLLDDLVGILDETGGPDFGVVSGVYLPSFTLLWGRILQEPTTENTSHTTFNIYDFETTPRGYFVLFVFEISRSARDIRLWCGQPLKNLACDSGFNGSCVTRVA